MAHFAKIGFNNIVEEVIVVNNDVITQDGVENEQLGIDFLKGLHGEDTTWVQTSFNGSFRHNFASIGGLYSLDFDAFIDPKPYDSWILNTDNYQWKAPVDYPTDGDHYTWNEITQQWSSRITAYTEE